MSTFIGLIVLGFGGHARSVADVALSAGIADLIFVDDNARPGEVFGRFPVVRDFPASLVAGWAVMPASGDNHTRAEQLRRINANGWPVASVVSKSASIGFGAILGPGCFIAHHAHIGPLASVGEGVILNTGAVVEHDCRIGDFVHVSVNATVAGKTNIGNYCFLGAGSTVIDGVVVTAEVTVGAGACVHRDLKSPGTYVGVPAIPLPGSK